MKISIFQSILTSYRLPLLKALARIPGAHVRLYSDVASSDYGVSSEDKNNLGFSWYIDDRKLMKRVNVASVRMCKNAVVDNDVIVHFADFKYPSLYFCMILSILLRRRFFLHGQGGYKKHGLFHALVYNFSLLLSDGYICYSHFSKDSLRKITLRLLHKKISVVDNSLYLPAKKITKTGSDILYIGRLRPGCGIELLLEAAAVANLHVRVVGGGDIQFVKTMQHQYENFTHYGAIFDEEEQFAVAQGCFAGAYGGDAGLSVVHYMAYGLPVIVHDDLYKHMGPEPSYIVHGENGLTFQRGDLQSLVQALTTLKSDVGLQNKLAEGRSCYFSKVKYATHA
jgi:glycosyltransferase involved in cell wall biosynthesis